MGVCSSHTDCSSCSGRFICHCLQVTEAMLTEAIEMGGLRTVNEVRAHTGAGDGCTACHRRLRQYLERRVGLPLVQSSSA